MGSTASWSADIYDRTSAGRLRSGTTSYTDKINSGEASVEANPIMDILDHDKNQPRIRESRDSKNHPNSIPIIVGFDDTGSMDKNPYLVSKDLKKLFSLLQRQSFIEDPQIAVCAYGDMYEDYVPIQFGQFESGNEIDEELDSLYIEHGGGGNDGETSALIPYYASKYIQTDAWDKRHRRGYMFLIGDECSLDLSADGLRQYLGEDRKQSVSAKQAFKMASKKWDIYFLLIDNWQAEAQHSRTKYSSYIGEDHVITLQSGEQTAATIAAIIGAKEKTTTADELSEELTAVGFDNDTALQVSEATKELYRTDSGDTVAVNTENVGDLDLS